MYYLDNAASSFPKPPSVHRAYTAAICEYGANPGRSGHELALRAAGEIYNVREKVAGLFGCQPENVIFTQNATHALNTALFGTLKRGDHVLVSDLEHNAVRRPLYALAEQGVEHTVVRIDMQNDRRTISNFESRIHCDTRMICVTAVSNVFGNKLPYTELGELCRRYGLLFVLDASQGAGVFDIDMQRDNIDILCTAGHKSLYGAQGSGVMALAGTVYPRPLMYGGSGGQSMLRDMPRETPDRYEAGTLNTPAIVSLGAGITYITCRGMDNIACIERGLAAELYGRLEEMPGVITYCAPQSGTFSFNIKGLMSEQVAARLDEQKIAVRGGLHCAPLAHKKMGTLSTGTVRVSFGAFNTRECVEKFCVAVKKIINSV